MWLTRSLCVIGLSAILGSGLLPVVAIAQTTDPTLSDPGIPIPVEQPPVETPVESPAATVEPSSPAAPSNLLTLTLGRIGSIGIDLNLDPHAVGGLINFARPGETACRVGEFNTARNTSGTLQAELVTGDTQAECSSNPGLGFRFDAQPSESGVSGSFSLGGDRDGTFQISLP